MLPIAGQRLDRMDQNFLWRGVFQAKENRNFFFEIFFQIFFSQNFFPQATPGPSASFK